VKSTIRNRAAAIVATICYFGLAERPVHATPECGQFATHDIGPNTAFVVANDAWNDPGQCIDWNTDSSFSVTTVPGTGYGYPHIMQGQSYGDGPTTNSGMPIQVSALQSWPVTWNIGGTTASGQWDAAVEFWATTYNPTGQTVNQADGTELMVWLSASNQTPGGLPVIGQVTIGGVLWDVRASLWGGPAPEPTWNYVAFDPANGVQLTSIHTDFKPFFDHAKTLTGDSSKPCRNGTQGTGQCLYDSFWVTSVQAGFEVLSGSVGLDSSGFSSAVNSR
jgi:hypothetical protein